MNKQNRRKMDNLQFQESRRNLGKLASASNTRLQEPSRAAIIDLMQSQARKFKSRA